ncbi:MAG: hypothetical protein ABIV06_10985, partial [Thermoanaerobaculia bacterium]
MRVRGSLHLLMLAMLFSPLALLAIDGPFHDLSPAASGLLPARGEHDAPLPARYRTLELDLGALEDLLAMAPGERTNAALAAPLLVTLPFPDGSDRLFRVESSPILEAELA